MGQEREACWICGAPANSGEHRLKRSDARATFGPVSQERPIYFNSEASTNVRLKTVNAPVLKFTVKLCEACNTRRTQPFDRSWERLARLLREQEANILEAGGFDLAALFGAETEAESLHLHLFFVKLTLGQIVMSGSRIDREPFRRALLGAFELESLYLKFCVFADGDPTRFAGQSDVEEWRDLDTGDPVGLAWAYMPGFQIELQILWSASGDEFLGAWRPGLPLSWIELHKVSLES